jgi:NTP pyrophosphatase (non-canonical NTP hydrolase)
MDLKEIQEEVDKWIMGVSQGYWTPHVMLARLTEETGELAREINNVFGPKKKKDTEKTKEISDEMGDILFTLCCIANSMNINLEDSVKNSIRKCYTRDKNRWKNKDKSSSSK